MYTVDTNYSGKSHVRELCCVFPYFTYRIMNTVLKNIKSFTSMKALSIPHKLYKKKSQGAGDLRVKIHDFIGTLL